MHQDPQPPLQPKAPSQADRSNLLRLLLPTVVLIGAGVIAAWLLQTGPQAKSRPQLRNAVFVQVRPVTFERQATTVSVMGTVVPERQVILSPQVSGKIIRFSDQLVPGGRFGRGEALLTIDPSDYRLAVQQLISEVARVEADRQIELGRQRVARKEYELLGEEVSKEEKALMLREPQLANIQAISEATKARLEQARLDLDRTVVRAPFNAVVMSRQIDLGASVTPGTNLVTLVGSDRFWIDAAVPASQLQWIRTGQVGRADGSRVRIVDTVAWGPGRFRAGRVIGLTASVEEQGRMAKLLIEVPDPLALQPEYKGQPSLLLGSYVRAEIEGISLPRAARIERDLIHDGSYVWIMNEHGTLDIRPVEVAFRGQDHVLVTAGLESGERLVTSNLPSPVQGMHLRVRDPADARPSSAEQVKP